MPFPRWFRRAEQRDRDDARQNANVAGEVLVMGVKNDALVIRTLLELDRHGWPDCEHVALLIRKRHAYVRHVTLEPTATSTAEHPAWWVLGAGEEILGVVKVVRAQPADAGGKVAPRKPRRRQDQRDPVRAPDHDLEIWTQIPGEPGWFQHPRYPRVKLTQADVTARGGVTRVPAGRMAKW